AAEIHPDATRHPGGLLVRIREPVVLRRLLGVPRDDDRQAAVDDPAPVRARITRPRLGRSYDCRQPLADVVDGRIRLQFSWRAPSVSVDPLRSIAKAAPATSRLCRAPSRLSSV